MKEEEVKKGTPALGVSKKMSYEQMAQQLNTAQTILNQQAGQFRELQNRYNMAVRRIQELEYGNAALRIKTCFDVLDHESHFSVDFVNECVKEIEEIMTPKAPEVEEEDKENPDAGE